MYARLATVVFRSPVLQLLLRLVACKEHFYTSSHYLLLITPPPLIIIGIIHPSSLALVLLRHFYQILLFQVLPHIYIYPYVLVYLLPIKSILQAALLARPRAIARSPASPHPTRPPPAAAVAGRRRSLLSRFRTAATPSVPCLPLV